MKKIIYIFFLVCSNSLYADNINTKKENHILYDCKYNFFASPNGLLKVEDNFGSKFTINKKDNKALLIGSIGVSEVSVIKHDYGITFLDVGPNGDVSTTTIQDSTGEVVHSRNSIVFKNFMPTQYYGYCKKWG